MEKFLIELTPEGADEARIVQLPKGMFSFRFTHRVPVGRDITIHGHHYDVGDLGYHWIMEWQNGVRGEHNTQDVSFTAGSLGIYRLTLPVVDGEVIVEIVVEGE